MAPPFLTNLGRGGRAHPWTEVLPAVFGPGRTAELWACIRQLALWTAEALAARHPHLADLGLDVGLDAQGHPWLLEVNFRDQRWSLRAAGCLAEYAALYRNPLAYACHLLARGTAAAPPDRPRGPSRTGLPS